VSLTTSQENSAFHEGTIFLFLLVALYTLFVTMKSIIYTSFGEGSIPK